jgi:hypothetical protein
MTCLAFKTRYTDSVPRFELYYAFRCILNSAYSLQLIAFSCILFWLRKPAIINKSRIGEGF